MFSVLVISKLYDFVFTPLWLGKGESDRINVTLQNPARTSVAWQGGGGMPNKRNLEATRSFGPNIKIVEFLEFHTFLPNITG